MWFIALLVLLNAFANNVEFVNTYRISIGGIPANILDGLVALGLIIALFRPRSSAAFFKTEHAHPAFWWIIIFFVLAIVGGMIGASSNGATLRQVLTAARNLLAAPAALYMAYFLTGNLTSSRRFLYVTVLGGLVVSFMIVVFFKEQSADLSNKDVTSVRAVAYVSAYAGLAMVLLAYTLQSGIKLFSLPVAVVFMGICLVGQFTTLSRSDWLAAAFALMAVFMLLPREQRAKSALRAIMAIPLLMASMWIGMYSASQFTGRNIFAKMHERLLTMLPGDRPGVKKKAWDSRLPGIISELQMFASSPFIGGGFAIQDTPLMDNYMHAGLRHNAWSATLAETGILGFAAYATLVGSCIVVGRRMVRDRTDQTTVLMGALGVGTGVFFIIHGMTTMSFNQMRWGLPLFVVAGVLLRTRSIQTCLVAQTAIEAEYSSQNPEAYAFAEPDHGADIPEPVFGNWYETN